jgi:hypothetical protein
MPASPPPVAPPLPPAPPVLFGLTQKPAAVSHFPLSAQSESLVQGLPIPQYPVQTQAPAGSHVSFAGQSESL